MNIDCYRATDEDDCRDGLVIKVDGKVEFTAFDGEREDNTLGRNFNDCYSIVGLMEQAFEASTDRQSLNITFHDISWDELYNIF